MLFAFFNTIHEFGSEKMEDLQRQLLGWLALERELGWKWGKEGESEIVFADRCLVGMKGRGVEYFCDVSSFGCIFEVFIC